MPCKEVQKQIHELFNSYLGYSIEKMIELMRGAISSAERNECPPWLGAHAWMTLGIVQGSGQGDLSRAREAFDRALALDFDVPLDAQLATEGLKQVFEEARAAARNRRAPKP